MPSIRTRAANRLVVLIGIKRRLQRLAAVDDDPAAFARILGKLRRTDRTTPPRRLEKAWDHERVDVDGFALHMLTAKDGTHRRMILYLHGGGYMFGPFGTEWSAMRSIASGAKCDFAMLLYPRAPEYQAPRTIEIAVQAFAVIAARYGAPNVILAGTSAGGGLGIVMMAELRDRGEPLPARAVLLSPGVDMTLREDVRHLERGDSLLSIDHVRSAGALYAGALGADHRHVSPIFGDLSGLAPMHVFAGTREILYPSLEAFVRQASAAGTEADLVVGVDQQHTWPAAPTPEGREARKQIVEIIGVGGEE